MSHFSKIKTNISNLNLLKKTVGQLGLYSTLQDSLSNLHCMQNLVVYEDYKKIKPLFSFIWDNSEYHLVVDLQLWSLNVDFDYFIDKLSQQYAYNVVVDKSLSTGFQKISEKVSTDGSIKVTVSRWPDCF
uniref:Uncharacterized protein ycf35 n=1 Tax=Bostrychia moritziana TaxID=103713 RepID=A0A1Z1M6F4_BOSMO|nr:hypothetical protein [Bostrychia moritziana]ARW61586.1 hypothetical protein [Bostrychia moritziana]